MSDDPMSRAIQQIEFLQHQCDTSAMTIVHLQAEVERLRTERDEAGRLYCCWREPHQLGDGTAEAAKCGWGCFKNKTTVTDSRSANAALDKLSQLDEEIGL